EDEAQNHPQPGEDAAQVVSDGAEDGVGGIALAAFGGDEGGFHAELVRRPRLALADALHLRSMERIQFPAALALLLRADLVGTCERPAERGFEAVLAGNLAPDIAHQPTKPRAQDA